MHLKYKAESWNDIVGNKHIKESIRNYKFDTPLMFEGEKGCGKTSMVNILINEFGVDKNNVKTINCGHFSDIKTAREEISNLSKSSLYGNKKVLVLDEVHTLKKQVQDAWLIPLETLRDGVLVFACTTLTEKLQDTFLRRFIRYKVKGLSYDESVELIDIICKKENIRIKKWIKALVVERSQGIPGLILTALPKVIDIEDQVTAELLLDVNVVEGMEYQTLNLFKYIGSSTEWSVVKKEAKMLYDEFSADRVRIDLMNVIAYRLSTLNGIDIRHGDELLRMFEILNESHSVLEWAGFITTIFKLWKGNN